MIIDPVLVPVWLTLAAAVLMFVGIALAAFKAPWRALISVPERQHLLFGGLFAVLMLWWLSIEVAEGAWFHLLGVTTLTLMVLIAFPEGFINGMLITAFTVMSPHLVKTFDDDYYLGD